MNDTADQATQAWRKFLESGAAGIETPVGNPQIKKTGFQGNVWWELPCPRIQLHCQVDEGMRWFECSRAEISGLHEGPNYEYIDYACRDCGRSQKTYSVVIVLPADEAEQAVVKVTKFGEQPPSSVPIANSVEKLLDRDDLELYRKGVCSETHGLGIAAATYFRRIVENQWRPVVSKIREAADSLGTRDLSPYDAALNESQFAGAVEMLKDAIPPRLLILDGQNPLTLLHNPLTIDLHRLSDEECLQQAADIRMVLTALLESVADALKDQAELKDAAARLQQLKA